MSDKEIILEFIKSGTNGLGTAIRETEMLVITSIIIGIIVLVNQIRIRKQLRRIQEQLEQKEDRP